MAEKSPKKTASRGRRAARLGVKILFSATLTLLLVEVGLRIVGIGPVNSPPPPRDSNELHSDSRIAEAQRRGWIPWPTPVQSSTRIPEHSRGYVEIRRNRGSLREDQEIPLDKPLGALRLMCIGDSHTDGVCWNPESYPNQLEALLASTSSATLKEIAGDSRQQSPITSVDVINAGFGPSSPYQQVWAYQQAHRLFSPDLVIVGFYAGNDLVDLLRMDAPVRLESRDGEWKHIEHAETTSVAKANPNLLETLKQPLRDHSSTYHALTKISWLRQAVVKRIGMGDPYRNRLEYAALVHPAPVWQGLQQAYYFRHHAEEWPTALQRQRRTLEILLEQTQKDGTQLRLIIIPTKRQIEPETDAATLSETAAILELTPDDLETDRRACDEVVELARNLRIPYLDLRPALLKASQANPEESLYFQFDHHLNVSGNRVVAQELARFLSN
jgi:lysophospholipase L1-like esterase